MARINVEHVDEEQQVPEPRSERAQPPAQATHKNGRGGSRLLLLAAIVIISGGTYQLLHTVVFKGEPEVAPAQQASQLSEAEQLHQKLRQTLDLPEETPNLATVQDVSKVKDQLFFQRAQNGDKVLLYVKAGRAVLYRPTTGKVINLAPINSDTETPQETN